MPIRLYNQPAATNGTPPFFRDDFVFYRSVTFACDSCSAERDFGKGSQWIACSEDCKIFAIAGWLVSTADGVVHCPQCALNAALGRPPAPTCPECQGTGVYRGLNEVTPCRVCGNEGCDA